ncbi:MAG: hypothetical protein ABJB66_09500, partial [Gemmatimonadaceae bacterium]
MSTFNIMALQRIASAPTIALALCVSVSCTSAQERRPQDLDWLSSLAKQFPCSGNTIVVKAGRQVDERGACTLTRAAQHEVALGHATAFGVSAADTARITTSHVSGMLFKGVDGAPDDAYWSVIFEIEA